MSQIGFMEVVHKQHRLFAPDAAASRPPEQEQANWRPRGETVYKTAVFLGSMIVVAVLLLVLICMARWESIMRLVSVFSTEPGRWMRRQRRSNTLQREPSDVEASVDMSTNLWKKNRSHNRKAVEALPVVNYSSSPSLELVGTECTICLCEFTDGDRVRILPDCYHGFHVECVDVWLIARASCPSCRASLHTKSNRKCPSSSSVNSDINLVVD